MIPVLSGSLGVLTQRPQSIPFSSGSTLLTGLVSWWNLDETSGIRYDAVGSNDLTDNNTVLYTSAGKIGNAASFDAANQERLTISGLTPWTPRCVSFWVKLDNVGATYEFLVGAIDAWSSDVSIQVYKYSNQLYCTSSSGGALQQAGGTGLVAGVWLHIIAGVNDSNQPYWYINNSGTSTGTALAGVPDSTTQINIGTYPNGSYAPTCEIDLVGMWDRDLTADERTELYNYGASIKNAFTDNGEGFRQDLMAYYKMEETSGTRYNSANIMSDGLQSGLVSFWELDETSGIRYDSVGSNDLTDNNTVLYEPGKIGNAAAFVDANNEYLSGAPYNPTTSGVYTAGWLRLDSITNEGPWGQNGSANQSWGFVTYSNLLNFRTSENGSGTYEVAVDGTALLGGGWHFIEGYWSPGIQGVAIDGAAWTERTASVPATIHPAAAGEFWVGGYYNNGYTIDGACDLVGIWSRVPTSDERTELYNFGKGKHQGNALALTDNNTVLSAAGISGTGAAMVKANSEYLTLAEPAGKSILEFTVNFWFKLSHDGLTTGQVIFTLYTYSNMILYPSAATPQRIGHLGWTYYDGGYRASGAWGDWGDAEAWHMYSVIHSVAGGFSRSYLDGVIHQSAPVPTTTLLGPGSPVTAFGASTTGTNPANGTFDEILMADRAFSADEIAALYNAGAGRFYDFNTL